MRSPPKLGCRAQPSGGAAGSSKGVAQAAGRRSRRCQAEGEDRSSSPATTCRPGFTRLSRAINAHLGNIGKTVHLTAPIEATIDKKTIDLKTLVGEMAAKQVDVLLILGGEQTPRTPPRPMSISSARSKNVPFTFHLGGTRTKPGCCASGTSPKPTTSKRGATSAVTTAPRRFSNRSSLRSIGGKSAIEVVATILKSKEAGVPGSQRDPLDIVKGDVAMTWFTKAEEAG